MRFLQNCWLGWLAAVLACGLTEPSAQAEDPLDFKEVYDLIRSQLPDLPKGDVDHAAAQGLIEKLDPRVQMLGDVSSDPAEGDEETVAATKRLEGRFAYLRLARLNLQTPEAFQKAWQDLAATNQIEGLIFDLRFASGYAYEATAKVADLFLNSEEPMLDWGQGIKKATLKTNAIQGPVVVLVNRQTSEAAEALAAVLSSRNRALLVGSSTAGQASMYREFTLTSGHQLRIAVRPVQLGDGTTMTTNGFSPDLQVQVPLDYERAWLEDPMRIQPDSSSAMAEEPTTPTSRRRINEADLVRMFREGDLPDTQGESGLESPGPRLIQDPALARAIDFLKGLAVVRQFERP